LRATEHGTQHLAEPARTGVILLQRTEQRLCTLRLTGVAAQRAEQQRQRRTDRRLGLLRIQAELLRHLPDGRALQLRG
jgi:hypothetical protein